MKKINRNRLCCFVHLILFDVWFGFSSLFTFPFFILSVYSFSEHKKSQCGWGCKYLQVTGGWGWAWTFDVPVKDRFPQVEMCTPGWCVSPGKTLLMNSRPALCLIKFHLSLISILPSKNIQHTSGFYWLVGADSGVQALPCKLCR